VPSGWDEWHGLVRNSRFYNYTVNINGEKVRHSFIQRNVSLLAFITSRLACDQVRHGFDYSRDYFPDLITNNSLTFLRNSKTSDPDRPLLMVMSYPGPHGPEDSAPQYQDLFFNVTTHQ